MKDFIYQVTEENVDGCGSDATEYIKFQLEEPLNNRQKASFQDMLRQVKAQPCNSDLSTEDMINDALIIFNKIHGTNGELCAQPFSDTITF